ncbi:DPP1-diacylglycerol pyrophosphate phosphatase-like protein [Rhizoctonia solani AG-3 Rhs1AP]|uniref:DPP1-diacylglycerol pyrophosphate phosphatase-like protein n=2 Tax=Rhizoctonia solani AG-3 TaxID=1086053 RepID=X8J4I7_9AGAM|nr:DPP1-diacylglycerol pyrophosphate phosphatase-like protein [Rhizoctonia solani AG-3 Rhs1AP]KEP50819.1 putative diacylglycerol pyrophosphate phosphatase [Rhizoctonia solani 123E]
MFGRNAPPRTRNMQLLFSYLPDWIVTCGLAAAFFALDKIDGFRREFSLTDTTIQHTYTEHERVPNWMLIVLCFGVPTIIMPIVNMLTVRSWWDWHNSMLGLVLGLATTGAVTQVVKVTVGRPRPDAIARCRPQPDAHDTAVFGLVTTSICTETDAYKMTDGWRSFFSGHSSLSFAGLGFFSFYLAGKLHLFDERGHTGKAWIALTPLTGALLVAISRTMDYRHHWQDVLVGSIVGLVFAYFAYRQYYPTLESPLSHKPYSPRIPREDAYRESSTLPFTRSDDEHTVHNGAYRRFSLGKGQPGVNDLPYDGTTRPYHAYPPVASSSEVRLGVHEDDQLTAIGTSPPGGSSPKGMDGRELLVGYDRRNAV